MARTVRHRLAARLHEMADLLGELVRIESGSDDPDGLARMAACLGELFAPFGRVVEHPLGPEGAPHLVIDVAGHDPGAPPALAVGHYDTVWPRGTLARLPFAVRPDGVAVGPGCFDMKAGLLVLYYALAELAAVGRGPRRPLRILLSCDEETGSRTSRELIADVATGAGVAFVLESPLPGGGLKTARKGGKNYRLEVHGRAAHAGLDPERGVSAVVELAHQVQRLHALNDADRGTLVNIGVVRGGTRLNVIPAYAEAEVNARVSSMAELQRVDRLITGLEPVLDGAKLHVVALSARPPMERTPATGRLFARARAIAAAMGESDLAEGGAAGASDGNLVAALGVPTLDGMGPEGGGAHADDEHVLLDSLPSRAALLAGLLAEV